MQKQADHQEEDVEQRQHGITVVGEVEDGGGELLGHLLLGQIDADQRRGGDQQHDHGGLYAALDDRVLQEAPVEFAIDQAADEQRRDHGQAAAFGGGDQAAEDAAKDDDRQNQGPDGLLEGAP